MSWRCFSTVELAPRDPILGLTEQFVADPNPDKVNLGVGVYYDEKGKLPLLKCVAAAEKAMVETPKRARLPPDRRHRRLRQGGAGAWSSAPTAQAVTSGRIATVQALGGTGGLKVGADFLKRLAPGRAVLISDPSWENHRALFTRPASRSRSYPYYDAATHGIRFDAMLAALKAAPAGTVVVLHACCHNPTGCDLTLAQWRAGRRPRARRAAGALPRHGLPGLRRRHRRGRRRRRACSSTPGSTSSSRPRSRRASRSTASGSAR